MSIVYHCTACDRTHPSRLPASRIRSFQEVISRIGEVSEPCPDTGRWVTVTYQQMEWVDDQPIRRWI